MSFEQFLAFVGGPVAIGFVLSFVAERWGFFQKQSSDVKELILMGIAFVMALASHVAIVYTPPEAIKAIDPYFQVLLAAFNIVVASQVWHNTFHAPGSDKIQFTSSQ